MRFTREGWPEKKDGDDPAEKFRKIADSLSVCHGCLLYGARVVIPTKLRRQVLDLLHECHFGIQRIKQLARTAVYWPNIDSDILDLCRQCSTCAEHQSEPSKAAVHPWMLPDKYGDATSINYNDVTFHQMTPNLVILPGCPKAEKRTPPFPSSSRPTLRQRPPGPRRRHKTLARNMDRAILGDRNGRENLVNFFAVKVTNSLPHRGGVRVLCSRTFLVHVWLRCRGADCFCGHVIIMLRRALICFTHSVPRGLSLNTVAFAGNSFLFHSIRFDTRSIRYALCRSTGTVCLVFFSE